MAEAYGKLTGRPGVCLVTRAPGATHAAVGVHTAYQDSTPLSSSSARCRARHLGREAFQELDYARMFGEMAKWVTTPTTRPRVPELVSHAFHTATSGRPGPVVIALPEDVAGRRGRRRRRGPVPAPRRPRPPPATSTARSSSSPAPSGRC